MASQMNLALNIDFKIFDPTFQVSIPRSDVFKT